MALKNFVFAIALAAAIVDASVLNHRQLKLTPTATLVIPPVSTKPPNRFPHEAESCNKWHEVQPRHVCDRIVEIHKAEGLTLVDLYKWNPDIDKFCSNLMPGNNVCIGVEDDGSSLPGPLPPTPTPHVPAPWPYPVMSGVTEDCTKFHKIVEGDICIGIIEKYGVDFNKFMGWNSGVNPDCKNLWVGYFVCVGV